MSNTSVTRIAGVVLVAGSLAFVAVFSYLAAAFGYPDVLDHSAAEVLPQLLAGGTRLRAVWFVYGALPLAFVFAGLGAGALLDRGAPAAGSGLRTLGVAAAVTAGVAMMIGLLRWPTLMWALAGHWGAAPAAAQIAMAAVFDAANLYLGNLIGEFVGELSTAIWFLAVALAWRRAGRRVLGGLGVAAAAIVALAALRNMTTLVDPIAAANNLTLPVWLIVMGVTFARDGRRAALAPVAASVASAVQGHGPA
jgi:hypothetical protein